MMRNLQLNLWLCVLLAIALASCGKDKNTNAGSGGQEVRFEITEGTDGPMTITYTFEFHCIDRTNTDCPTCVYVPADPDGGADWMGYPMDYSDCIPFYAVITYNNREYTFSGDIVGEFGDASEPFVTGFYQYYEGDDFGSGNFEFYQQDLVEGDSPDCGD